jgi:hypothetical protein
MSHGLDLFNDTARLYAEETRKEQQVVAASALETRAKLQAIVELSQSAGWAVFAAELKVLVNHSLQQAQSTPNSHEAAVHLGELKLGLRLMAWLDATLAQAKMELEVRP